MAFEIPVKVDPSQAKSAIAEVGGALGKVEAQGASAGAAVSRSFREGAASAEQLKSATEGAGGEIERLIALVETFAGLHTLEQLVDSYTELSNRLRGISKDQANLNGMMDETFKIAQDTRSSWDSVAQVYSRLEKAGEGLGKSQADMLQVTRILTEGIKLSGSSATEAQMTMNEFAHAMATGTMTAREMRVALKDAPMFMRLVAEASGQTTGQLLEMAHHGGIAAKTIVDGFLKAGPAVHEAFGNVLPTIADGFLQVKNAAEKFFGEAGQGSGVMKALTDALKFVAGNFDTIGKSTLAVIQVFGGLFIIEKIIALVRMLSIAIAANPLGALALALATTIALLRQFGDELDAGIDGSTKVSAVFEVLWGDIKELGGAIKSFLTDAWHALTEAFSDGLNATGIELSIKNVGFFIAAFVDAAKGEFDWLKGHALEAFGALAIGVGDVFIKVGQAIAKVFEDIVNKAIDAANYLGDAIYDKLNNTDDKRAAAQKAAQAESLADTRRFIQQLAIEKGEGFNQAVANPGLIGLQTNAAGQITDPRVQAIQANNLRSAYIDQGLSQTGGNNRESAYNHVDFSFQDPLKGAMEDVKKFTAEGITEAMKESSAKDYWAGVIARAASLPSGAARESSISTDKGAENAHIATKEEEAAAEKLLKELRGVVEQSNGVTDAQEKLAHAQDIVNEAMKVGSGPIHDMIQKYGGGAAIMERYAQKLKDALDPFGALVTKTIESSAALRDNADEQQRAQTLQKDINELKQKGVVVTDAQIDQLKHLIAYDQDHHKLMAEEQAFYNQIIGPAEKYELALRALKEMWDGGTISNEQYVRAIDQQRLAYLDASGEARTFAGGVEKALLQIKDEATDVGAAVGKVFVDAFHHIEDAIAELVVKGTTDFKKMVEEIESDMVHLLLRQGENALFGLGGGSDQGGSASAAAMTGAMTAGGAAAGGEIAAAMVGAGAAAGAAIAAQMAAGGAAAGAASGVSSGGFQALTDAGMLGAQDAYAGGGAFTVGGSGGTDSQAVAFRATPGERVTIQTPSQRMSSATPSSQTPAARPVVHNHIHLDKRDLLTALEGPEFEEMVSTIAVRAVGPQVALRSRSRP